MIPLLVACAQRPGPRPADTSTEPVGSSATRIGDPPNVASIVPADADGDGADAIARGGDDCDDHDATVAPGTPEDCGDGVDQDCDGADPACPEGTSLSLADSTLRGAADGDGAGTGLAVCGDGEVAEVLVVAPWTSAFRQSEGSTYRIAPPPTGVAELAASEVEMQSLSDRPRHAACGDVDGDGVADALIAAVEMDEEGSGWTVTQASAGTARGLLGEDQALYTIADDYADGGAGGVLAADLSGTGQVDVVANLWGRHNWAAVVLDPDRGRGRSAASYEVAAVESVASDLRVNTYASADFDGDGFEDLVVVAGDATGSAAFLVDGPIADDRALEDAQATWTDDGSPGHSFEGALAGDIDGDGSADVVLSSREWNGLTGEVFGLTRPLRGGAFSEAELDVVGGFEGALAQALTVGDLDGDGRGEGVFESVDPDVRLGEVRVGFSISGGTWAVADTGPSFYCPTVTDGAALAAIADLDGDGAADLAVGVPQSDAGEGPGYVAILSGARWF